MLRMKWRAASLITLLVLLVLVIGSSWVISNNRDFLKELVAIDCNELPYNKTVQQVLETHQSTVKHIEQVNPGFVFVAMRGPEQCPDKAYVLIIYATLRDKKAIKDIIRAETFLGMPYRLQNA